MRLFDTLPRLLARLAVLLGLAALWHYLDAGLTLSHYDAKAHLVVARRIADSLTPGWEQIGAVWLPLPHVLNAVPVQVDALYRTGASAIVLSMVSHGLAVASLAGVVLTLTGSRAGAVLAAALFATNPNILYLQATPMTEPLLFGLTALLVLLLTRWVVDGRLVVPHAAGVVIVLACLTRYEAWPVTGAAIVATAYAWWRQGQPMAALAPVYARLLAYPAGAVLGFMLLSRLTVGAWFVTGGFYVPDPALQGQPLVVLDKILEGTAALGGTVLVRVALVCLAGVVALALWRREHAALLVPVALLGAAALPFYAFVSGHPFRIRYEIAIIVAAAVIIGLGVGLLRRLAPVAAAVIVVLVFYQAPPFAESAMVREATRDRRNGVGRLAVTACLTRDYGGETIMASMGALAHYMHELSHAGFGIGDFLHEGNGTLWHSAMTRGPAHLAGWVLVEEKAEGGDMLFQQQQATPRFLEGFDRVCEGGNVALYRRR